jgi:hypothetical protein
VLRPACLLSVLGLARVAYAGPDSIVAGGQDPDAAAAGYSQEKVDVIGDIEYEYELDSATIVRERESPDNDPLGGVPTVRDLKFKQFKHTLTPRLTVGVYHDTFVYGALPIIIQQARELRFVDNSDRAASSTVEDGLLPEMGFDARDPGTALPGDLAFRGINRHGLDQVHFGLGTALMNQAKDDTKPTWKMGAEIRLALGSIMKFDAMSPGSNKGVSRGVHELKVWTTFAKKMGRAEPWVEMWWMTPLAEKSDSLFQNPGFGATNTKPTQQAAVAFGLELYALDNPADQTRISLDFGTRALMHFEGREYTEMWEVFALAGDSRGTGPLILDADPTRPGVQPLSHPGISNIENYLETTARMAIRAQIGPHVHFAVIGDLVWRTEHAISFADAGVDGPDDGDLVNPGTDEVNPLHAQIIDLVGHRYRSTDGFNVVLGVNGSVLF